MFQLSDNFWKRLHLVSGIFLLLATFCLLVFMAHLEIKDLDLWLHIGLGKYIVQHNFHVPSVDILSCTVAGKPWVNHEWLFQVIVYLIHSNWGVDGLITMQVWLVSLTLLLLVFLGYSRKNQVVTLFALFMVSLVYQSRFTIRPELFSLMFFTLYVVILAFFVHRKWAVGALFVIQVLWANIHGFFFFGPLIVMITIFAEWLKRHVWLPWDWKTVGRLTDKEYHQAKLILGMVIVACFLTPTGIHGAVYPLKVLFQISGDSKIFFSKIIELQKPITRATLFSMADWSYYRILIIMSFLTFVFNRRKIDVGILIFWLFFLVFSLSAIRNMVFFSFAAYLAIVANLTTVKFKDVVPVRFTSQKFLYITAAFAQVLIVLWAMRFYTDVQNNGYFDFDTYERKSEFGGVSQRQYPIKATKFLMKNRVHGNFFNDFNSGAYLVGHCFPNIKVFIDGRTEVYGPDFFKYYEEILEKDDVEKFKGALKRFQITGVFMNTVFSAAPENLLKYLYKSPEWSVVYFDYDGVVFLKNVPLNRDVISRNRIDMENWKTKKMDLYRLGSKEVQPYQYLNRAFTLIGFGLDDAAVTEARAALEVNPGSIGSYKVIAKVAAKKKDFTTAYENFRLAVTLNFNDQGSRMNMALALMDLKRFDEAAIQYQKIIDIWPSSPKPYIKLAKVEVFRKRYPAAFDLLKKGYELDASSVEDVVAAGDLFFEDKVYDLAEKTYLLVIGRDPQFESAYLKLCQVYERTSEREKAVSLLKKGLQKNPESKELKIRLRLLGTPSNQKP